MVENLWTFLQIFQCVCDAVYSSCIDLVGTSKDQELPYPKGLLYDLIIELILQFGLHRAFTRGLSFVKELNDFQKPIHYLMGIGPNTKKIPQNSGKH